MRITSTHGTNSCHSGICKAPANAPSGDTRAQNDGGGWGYRHRVSGRSRTLKSGTRAPTSRHLLHSHMISCSARTTSVPGLMDLTDRSCSTILSTSPSTSPVCLFAASSSTAGAAALLAPLPPPLFASRANSLPRPARAPLAAIKVRRGTVRPGLPAQKNMPSTLSTMRKDLSGLDQSPQRSFLNEPCSRLSLSLVDVAL